MSLKYQLNFLTILISSMTLLWAGFIIDDFENYPVDFNDQKTFDLNGYYRSLNGLISLSQNAPSTKAGNHHSLKFSCEKKYGSLRFEGLQHPGQNFYPLDNDRLEFIVYSDASEQVNHDISVKLYDQNHYRVNGFEIWTTEKCIYQQWSTLSVFFSQLPDDFDLTHVTAIEWTFYWPGTYYIDSVSVLRKDFIYQSFEHMGTDETALDDIVWAWGSEDDLSISTAMHMDGMQSLKLVTRQEWGGVGVRCQSKSLNPLNIADQSHWHVDFTPSQNNLFYFWIYALPKDENNHFIEVQFFDHDRHFTDDHKVTYTTPQKAIYKKWTRLSVQLNELPSTLNLSDINKIQFLIYWPGTYYIDGIGIGGDIPVFHENNSSSLLMWTLNTESLHYSRSWYQLAHCQQNTDTWNIVYRGREKYFDTRRLKPGYFKVRHELMPHDFTSFPYVSNWSDPVYSGSVASAVT